MRNIEDLLEQELSLNQFMNTAKDEEIAQLDLSNDDLEKIAREYENGDFE